MESTNFCRQLVEFYSSMIPLIVDDDADDCKVAIEIASKSMKFVLPSGGITLGDFDMRAIECDAKLPFEFCALEYLTPDDPRVAKVVLFTKQHGSKIFGWAHTYIRSLQEWVIDKPFMILETKRLNDGSMGYSVKELGRNHTDEPLMSTRKHSLVILDFINALSCSNVLSERIPARKKSKKTSNPIPFDDYHFLTISHRRASGSSLHGSTIVGSRKSPREHLRRGHIRRYQTGEKVWVNACAIGHNNVGGVVRKDYQMKGRK